MITVTTKHSHTDLGDNYANTKHSHTDHSDTYMNTKHNHTDLGDNDVNRECNISYLVIIMWIENATILTSVITKHNIYWPHIRCGLSKNLKEKSCYLSSMAIVHREIIKSIGLLFIVCNESVLHYLWITTQHHEHHEQREDHSSLTTMQNKGPFLMYK